MEANVFSRLFRKGPMSLACLAGAEEVEARLVDAAALEEVALGEAATIEAATPLVEVTAEAIEAAEVAEVTRRIKFGLSCNRSSALG